LREGVNRRRCWRRARSQTGLAKRDRVALLLTLAQRQREVTLLDHAQADDLGSGTQIAGTVEPDAEGAERLDRGNER
jgi:hypothetical protein